MAAFEKILGRGKGGNGKQSAQKQGAGRMLSSFAAESKRVLVVSKKPDWNEYKAMAKITALGIVLIAVVGFIVRLIFNLLGLGV